ncbi:MAG: hypothetical protein WA635_05510, partial [Gallionella sp.]
RICFRQTAKGLSHPHSPSVDEESSVYGCRFDPKLMELCPPSIVYLNHWKDIMRKPTKAPNIGADASEDEIVAASSEGSLFYY